LNSPGRFSPRCYLPLNISFSSFLICHRRCRRGSVHHHSRSSGYHHLAVRRDYSSPAARALRRPHRAPRLLVSGRTCSMSTSPCAATTCLRLHALYVNLVVHHEYSSPLSRLQRSTSTTPRVRVPRLVARLVAPLVVDYSASRRLVVDYFTSAARLGASARRAARLANRRAARRRLVRLAQARRRLLHLRRASGCLGTSRASSRGSSHGSSSITSPMPCVWVPRHVARLVSWIVARLVVDYFAYTARLGASACRAAHRLSSTTSPTPRGQVPRHVAWLVAPLVIDYYAYAARPGASARHAARHGVRRRLLRAPQLPLAATLALLQPRCASRLLVSRQHWLYFEYAARCHDVVFRSHRVDHSSRLVFQTSQERQSRPQHLVGINSD
jgi:hypothetical protein